MLRTDTAQAKPEIKRVVDQLLAEDSSFDRNDNRTTHREHLVRAVTVELREGSQTLTGFSRNISGAGVGIISDKPVSERSIAMLKISKLDGSDTEILAECRWCKTYGKNWHLSGWQFISLKR